MPTWRSDGSLALEVPRWAFAFYRRHLALVVGLSLIVSLERVVVLLWGAHLAGVMHVVSEIVVALIRLALFIAIFRLGILQEPRLADVDAHASWRRMAAFARRNWRALVMHVLLLAAAFTVFDLVPGLVIAPRVPDDAQPAYWATVLAIKNPTIIAFTFVWQIGVVRQMLLGAPVHGDDGHHDHAPAVHDHSAGRVGGQQ